MKNVDDGVKAIISEVLELDIDKVDPNANFVEEYGLDSLMALEILVKLEKHFMIQIPEENLQNLTTLNQTLDLMRTIVNEG